MMSTFAPCTGHGDDQNSPPAQTSLANVGQVPPSTACPPCRRRAGNAGARPSMASSRQLTWSTLMREHRCPGCAHHYVHTFFGRHRPNVGAATLRSLSIMRRHPAPKASEGDSGHAWKTRRAARRWHRDSFVDWEVIHGNNPLYWSTKRWRRWHG